MHLRSKKNTFKSYKKTSKKMSKKRKSKKMKRKSKKIKTKKIKKYFDGTPVPALKEFELWDANGRENINKINLNLTSLNNENLISDITDKITEINYAYKLLSFKCVVGGVIKTFPVSQDLDSNKKTEILGYLKNRYCSTKILISEW